MVVYWLEQYIKCYEFLNYSLTVFDSVCTELEFNFAIGLYTLSFYNNLIFLRDKNLFKTFNSSYEIQNHSSCCLITN